MQDLFGWRDRINLPGLISDANWTWRLPWPVDRLATTPEAEERAAFWRKSAEPKGSAVHLSRRGLCPTSSEPIHIPRRDSASRRIHAPTDAAIVLVAEILDVDKDRVWA